MSIGNTRIRQLIEHELRKCLEFTFTLERNRTAPGSRNLRKGDRARCKIWVRNGGDVEFERVGGLISATPNVSFPVMPFEVHGLTPREERLAATVDLRVLRQASGDGGHAWMANLTVVATVNLSEFQICESDRRVHFSAGRRSPVSSSRPRAIPLSKMPLDAL